MVFLFGLITLTGMGGTKILVLRNAIKQYCHDIFIINYIILLSRILLFNSLFYFYGYKLQLKRWSFPESLKIPIWSLRSLTIFIIYLLYYYYHHNCIKI